MLIFKVKTINMQNIRIATAQFETRNGDKEYNLSRIEELTGKATAQGARVVSFHELCIPSYTYLKNLDKEEMFAVAEEVPSGESTSRLVEISARNKVAVLAGLVGFFAIFHGHAHGTVLRERRKGGYGKKRGHTGRSPKRRQQEAQPGQNHGQANGGVKKPRQSVKESTSIYRTSGHRKRPSQARPSC